MAVKYRKGMKIKIKRNIVNLMRDFSPEEYAYVLDVGAKEGYAVDWFNKFGYKARGIETDSSYERKGIVVGNFLETEEEPGAFDIIFSRHSLEHIELENESGTESFLNKSSALLRTGGILYIIVPIKQWWEFYGKGSNLNGFEFLSRLIELFDFEIIKSRDRENALFVCKKL